MLEIRCRFFNLSTHRGLKRFFSAICDDKCVGLMRTKCLSSVAAALFSVKVAVPSTSTSPSPSMVGLQVRIASSAPHRLAGIVQAPASLGRGEGRPWARPPPPPASYSSRAEGSSGRGGWRVPVHRRPIDPQAFLIVSMLKRGESAFVIGIAGSGKTTILRKVVPFLEVLDPRMGVCVTNGVAASLLGGGTFHSWLGLVPEVVLAVDSEYDVEDVVARLPLPSRHRKCNARFLIVEEISMLDSALLDGVDRICRYLRRAPSTPLGGIVVLFCGEVLQLAPVQGHGALSGGFIFKPMCGRCSSARGPSLLRQPDAMVPMLSSAPSFSTCAGPSSRGPKESSCDPGWWRPLLTMPSTFIQLQKRPRCATTSA